MPKNSTRRESEYLLLPEGTDYAIEKRNVIEINDEGIKNKRLEVLNL